MLLSRLLFALSIFLELRGRYLSFKSYFQLETLFFNSLGDIGHVEGLRMAENLIQLVYIARGHQEASVRRSTLYSAITVVKYTPREAILVDFYEDMLEIKAWAESKHLFEVMQTAI